MSISECGKFIDLVNSNGACAVGYHGGKEKQPSILLFHGHLTGLGAQVKEHMGKCSIKIASFLLSKFGAILKVLVPSYSYILLHYTYFSHKMYYLFV